MLLAVLLTAAAIFHSKTLMLLPTLSLVPSPPVILAYFVFFGVGWLIYHKQDILSRLMRWGVPFLAAAVVLFPAYIFLRYSLNALRAREYSDLERAILSLAVSLVIWLFVLGLTGTHLKYLNGASRVWRYLSDASYWMYLSRLPIVLALLLALLGLDLSSFAKFTIVLTTTFATTLVTYHYAVRSTFIGLKLNGRIYPKRPAA